MLEMLESQRAGWEDQEYPSMAASPSVSQIHGSGRLLSCYSGLPPQTSSAMKPQNKNINLQRTEGEKEKERKKDLSD